MNNTIRNYFKHLSRVYKRSNFTWQWENIVLELSTSFARLFATYCVGVYFSEIFDSFGGTLLGIFLQHCTLYLTPITNVRLWLHRWNPLNFYNFDLDNKKFIPYEFFNTPARDYSTLSITTTEKFHFVDFRAFFQDI